MDGVLSHIAVWRRAVLLVTGKEAEHFLPDAAKFDDL